MTSGAWRLIVTFTSSAQNKCMPFYMNICWDMIRCVDITIIMLFGVHCHKTCFLWYSQPVREEVWPVVDPVESCCITWTCVQHLCGGLSTRLTTSGWVTSLSVPTRLPAFPVSCHSSGGWTWSLDHQAMHPLHLQLQAWESSASRLKLELRLYPERDYCFCESSDPTIMIMVHYICKWF